MLSHTSGLPDYYSLPEYPTRKYQRVTLPDLIAWVATKPLDFLPGSKSSYSNTGYGSWPTSSSRYPKAVRPVPHGGDLRPAGMKDTGTLRDEVLIPARADGYRPGLGDPACATRRSTTRRFSRARGRSTPPPATSMAWCRAIQARRFFDIGKLAYPYGWGARETKSRPQVHRAERPRSRLSPRIFLSSLMTIWW